jgi:hypothetical protein
MALEQNVLAPTYKVFLGEDKVIKFQIFVDGTTQAQVDAGTATPLDVTGYGLTWIVRKTDKADTASITKATGGLGITITGTWNASQGTSTQRIVITLVDTDTSDTAIWKPNIYRHSLKRTDDGSETILAFGDFEFLQATAR